MKIAFSAKPPKDTDLYLLGVTPASMKAVKGPYAKIVAALLDAYPEFAADAGDVITTVLPGFEYTRFGLLGMGKGDKKTKLDLERIGGKLMSTLITVPANDAFIDMPDLSPEDAANIASGVRLRAYEFRQYMTKATDQYLCDSVTIASASPAASTKVFAGLEAAGQAVHWARDLTNEPPNILHPISFAKRVVDKMKGTKVKVTVIDDKALRRMGAGAMIAVGQASEHQPRLVVLEYNGTGKKNSRPVALIGKGVTFDTGGYSLKPATGIVDMKGDMAGAAAVAGAILQLAKTGAKVHVVGALAMVENMVSDEAYRPSDILTSLSGQTIEVTNTDAEGRLILCDAMWYVQDKYKPRAMADIATLTGAAMAALGEEYAAIYANDNATCQDMIDASHATGDKVWRMPLDPAYNAMMDSSVADMRNLSASTYGGSCTAAAFLGRFVQDGVKWVHIDMAPVMVTRHEQALCPAGATGFGVRLLAEWVINSK